MLNFLHFEGDNLVFCRTVYDEFPTDFLPIRYKCGICKKLCHDPRVLDCLHTFCKRCLIELEASVNTGKNQFWRRITESGNFGWKCKAVGFVPCMIEV